MTYIKLSDVSDAEIGVWIAGSSVHNPIEFNIAIVDLAAIHGLEINLESWGADVWIFTEGTPTFEMIEELGFVAQDAFDYLNSLLPDGYYFDIDDGFRLCKEEKEAE